MAVWQMFLPLALSTALAAGGLLLQHRIAARSAAWMAVGGAVGVGAVGFTGAVLVSLQYFAHAPWAHRYFAWCQMFEFHHRPISTSVGVLSTSLAFVGCIKAVRVVRHHRRACRRYGDLRAVIDQAIVVQTSDAVFAFSVPGRTPLTVVSSGLLTRLKSDEQDIVFAHEAGHHQHRHDRFLFVGRIGASLFPGATLFLLGLEHALERWADEHAARVIGDRKRVAKTIAKTALLADRMTRSTAPIGILGFTVSTPFSTTQRVKSLLRPPQRVPIWAKSASAAAVAGLLTQIHHFEDIIATFCHM